MAEILLLTYGALGVMIVGTETCARVRDDREATLAAALDAVLARRPGRWLLLAGWAWLGWHLFVRATR